MNFPVRLDVLRICVAVVFRVMLFAETSSVMCRLSTIAEIYLRSVSWMPAIGLRCT